MGFGPLTDPLTVVALLGVRFSKHTDLGHFEPAGSLSGPRAASN
jgi:hypothetical protein